MSEIVEVVSPDHLKHFREFIGVIRFSDGSDDVSHGRLRRHKRDLREFGRKNGIEISIQEPIFESADERIGPEMRRKIEFCLNNTAVLITREKTRLTRQPWSDFLDEVQTFAFRNGIRRKLPLYVAYTTDETPAEIGIRHSRDEPGRKGGGAETPGFTENKVMELYERGLSQQKIADEVNKYQGRYATAKGGKMSKSTVGDIIRRKKRIKQNDRQSLNRNKKNDRDGSTTDT